MTNSASTPPSSATVVRGRLVDLPRPEHPGRFCLLLEDRLEAFETESSRLAGFRLGDLVALKLDASGRVIHMAREGEPLSGHFDETGDAMRWRRQGAGVSRMAYLRVRNEVMAAIRRYFSGEGFLEVDTPALVRAPSPEAQFSPLRAGAGFLMTSPEFQLKRMLVGGFEKIFRMGPVFRGDEQGVHHNPEFTMLEWYRVNTDLEAMAADLEGLLSALSPLAAARSGAGNPDLAPALASTPFRRLTVAEAMREKLGVRLDGVVTLEGLIQAAEAAGQTPWNTPPEDFSTAFFHLWERLEILLEPSPLLITHWPAPLASLARLNASDPTVAERMELYAGGMELANGFAELTDPKEQRRRFEADLAERQRAGLQPVPLDERFLEALGQGMPPCSGMALGVDRLVMLISGATTIQNVLPFSWEEL